MDDQEYNILKKITAANRFIPVPPESRNFVGGNFCDSEKFLAHACLQLDAMRRFGIMPTHSVLELGCGIGRLATILTQYLDATGYYLGVDINLGGIAWCHENIHQRYGNFDFVVVNAKNDHYRHAHEYGQQEFTNAEIPIPAGRTFDFVTAYSLFTHLQWEETQRYFAVVTALMKPGAVFLSTWFLIDDEARKATAEGKPLFTFNLSTSGPVHLLAESPHYSRAIACEEKSVLELAAQHSLTVVDVIKSPWRQGQLAQDVVVLRKGHDAA